MANCRPIHTLRYRLIKFTRILFLAQSNRTSSGLFAPMQSVTTQIAIFYRCLCFGAENTGSLMISGCSFAR